MCFKRCLHTRSSSSSHSMWESSWHSAVTIAISSWSRWRLSSITIGPRSSSSVAEEDWSTALWSRFRSAAGSVISASSSGAAGGDAGEEDDEEDEEELDWVELASVAIGTDGSATAAGAAAAGATAGGAIKRCSRPNAPIRIGSASPRAFGGRPRCAAEGAQGVHWMDPKRAASHRRSSVMRLTARQRTMPPPDAIRCSSVLPSRPTHRPSSHGCSSLLICAPCLRAITASANINNGCRYCLQKSLA